MACQIDAKRPIADEDANAILNQILNRRVANSTQLITMSETALPNA